AVATLAGRVKIFHKAAVLQLLKKAIVIEIFRVCGRCFGMVGDCDGGADGVLGDVGNFRKKLREAFVGLVDDSWSFVARYFARGRAEASGCSMATFRRVRKALRNPRPRSGFCCTAERRMAGPMKGWGSWSEP